MNTIGNKIKLIRQSKNVSQEQLGAFLGVTQSNYGRLEKNDSRISISDLIKISEFLKFEIVELFSNEKVKNENNIFLRDYFASKAMQGMITGIDTDAKFERYRYIASIKKLTVSEWISQDAYKQADAMIKQREL